MTETLKTYEDLLANVGNKVKFEFDGKEYTGELQKDQDSSDILLLSRVMAEDCSNSICSNTVVCAFCYGYKEKNEDSSFKNIQLIEENTSHYDGTAIKVGADHIFPVNMVDVNHILFNPNEEEKLIRKQIERTFEEETKKNYTTISSERVDIICDYVNRAIKKGFEPVGGLTFAEGKYTQVIYKNHWAYINEPKEK